MNIIASWSGGKDSCFALYKEMQNKHNVKCLVNFVSEGTKRGCFHGIDSALMQTQAKALGLELYQAEVPADMQEYERIFKETVLELKIKHSAQAMVFGDIYLDEHRDWVDRVCKDIGITPLEPLWGLDTKIIASDFIKYGFKTKIVSAKADLFDKNFAGQDFSPELVTNLITRNICPCGENGEFHTFVYDGPIFKKKIKITKTEKIFKDGFWKHWFLDLKEYYMEEK